MNKAKPSRLESGRYWINQPSSAQPMSKYHGLCVIVAEDTAEATVRVWPATGDIISIEMPRLSLSRGWPDHLAPMQRMPRDPEAPMAPTKRPAFGGP